MLINSETITITYDDTAPTVTAVSTTNIHTLTPTVTFNYTDALSATANCSIYISGTSYGNNAATANATNTAITLTAGGLVVGANNVINISCIDFVDNTGSTTTNINLTDYFRLNGTTYDTSGAILNNTP